MNIDEQDWEIERIIESSQVFSKTASSYNSNFTGRLLNRYALSLSSSFRSLSNLRKSLRDYVVTASCAGEEEMFVPSQLLSPYELPIVKICGKSYVKWDDIVSFTSSNVYNTNKHKYNENTSFNTSQRKVRSKILDKASSKLSFQAQNNPEESTQEIEVVYPTLDDILAHHDEALSLHGGKQGILGNGEDKLKAAIGRMQSGFGDSEFYPSIIEKAAILAHSIITTHPFSDANKRTAFLSTAYFLANHGITWDTDAEDFAEIIINVASNENDYEDILQWLQQNARDMADEEWEDHMKEANTKSEENPDAIKKLTWVDLPNAEQYESETSVYDPSPKEIVDAVPSRKKENNDPIRKRFDFNYEKDIFEKGLHQGDSFNSVNVNRPITPYGSSLKVERADIHDARELTKLSTQAFDIVKKQYHIPPPINYNSEESITHKCSEGNCFKLIKDNQVIGGAIVDYKNREFYLERIFLAPEYQGNGFGKQFISQVEDMYPNARVFGTNTPSVMKENIKFYKSMGYIPVGERTSGSPQLTYFSKSKRDYNG